MRRRLILIMLVLAMAAALAACGGGAADSQSPGASTAPSASSTPSAPSAPEPSERTGGSSVVAPADVASAPEQEDVKYADLIDIIVENPISVIDPLNPTASGPGCRTMYITIYDRLLKRVGEGIFEPELATSYESDDQQNWIFHLRDDVTFHNGDKFTAQDVVDTVMLSRDAPGTIAADAWRSVDTITAIDEYTVQITLSDVNVEFLFWLSLPGASILNKAARDADPVEGAWVGTGPYRVTEFVSSDYTVETVNDNYWGTKPLTKQLLFRNVPEMTARPIMIQNGESHVGFDIGSESLYLFVNDPAYSVITFIGNSAHCLMFNVNDPITGDKDFRYAVAHALSRPEIALVGHGDWGIPETEGTFWGNNTEFRNHDIPILEYDQQLAKEYLAASSYNGEEIEIIAGIPPTLKASELIQEQLGQIGINIRLFLTDGPTLQSFAKFYDNQAQITHHSAPFTQSAASMRAQIGTGGASNRSSYSNPKVDELLALAPTIVDPQERGAIYKQVQEIVAEDMPSLNLYWRMYAMVTSSNVGGILADPDQNHDFRGIFMIVED